MIRYPRNLGKLYSRVLRNGFSSVKLASPKTSYSIEE